VIYPGAVTCVQQAWEVMYTCSLLCRQASLIRQEAEPTTQRHNVLQAPDS
jgi:hypothetical protein